MNDNRQEAIIDGLIETIKNTLKQPGTDEAADQAMELAVLELARHALVDLNRLANAVERLGPAPFKSL